MALRKGYYPLPLGARDNAKEQVRRNQLAFERGYASRYEQRKAIERGVIAPIAPKRVSSPKTISAQEKRLAAIPKVKSRSATYADRELAYDWSAVMAKRFEAEYHPERALALGVSRYEYTQIYLRAFVTGDYRYKITRRKGGSDELGEWFVTLNHFYSATEYERRYAIR